MPLLDLSLQSGHCALMLDLRPQHSLADLTERDPDVIDNALLEGVLVRHDSGVYVLPAPSSPELADMVTTTLVDSVLTVLRTKFPYVVIDTPSRFDEVTLTALDQSDVIVLLLSPEIASLKVATAALDVFHALEYSSQKLVAVLNWPFVQGGLPQKNIEASLRMPLEMVIPHERTLFVEAINRGMPLVLSHPEAPASLALQKLAYRLGGNQTPVQASKAPSGMLLRVQELVKRA